jgi:hypothetical protein
LDVQATTKGLERTAKASIYFCKRIEKAFLAAVAGLVVMQAFFALAVPEADGDWLRFLSVI